MLTQATRRGSSRPGVGVGSFVATHDHLAELVGREAERIVQAKTAA